MSCLTIPTLIPPALSSPTFASLSLLFFLLCPLQRSKTLDNCVHLSPYIFLFKSLPFTLSANLFYQIYQIAILFDHYIPSISQFCNSVFLSKYFSRFDSPFFVSPGSPSRHLPQPLYTLLSFSPFLSHSLHLFLSLSLPPSITPYFSAFLSFSFHSPSSYPIFFSLLLFPLSLPSLSISLALPLFSSLRLPHTCAPGLLFP